MIKIKINKKISEINRSEASTTYGAAGEPDAGAMPLQARAGMEGYDPDDNELGYELEEGDCSCQCEQCAEESVYEEIDESLLYEKKDRCYYLAKQKYDVFPSAYASGFIVRCRKGKVGRKKKIKVRKKKVNESSEIETLLSEINAILQEGTFDKEKSQGLHGWFARKGGKGKSKGWVDCNTCRTNPKTGRKTCKTCGRQKGEKRGKYPACRPTPSACTRSGTRRKKSSNRVSWKPKNKTGE